MALIYCFDCRYRFSDQASACPTCHCPVPPLEVRERGHEAILNYYEDIINSYSDIKRKKEIKKGIIITRDTKEVELIQAFVSKMNEHLSKIGYNFELILIPNRRLNVEKKRDIKERLVSSFCTISLIIYEDQLSVNGEREIEDFIGFELVKIKKVISILNEDLYENGSSTYHPILFDFDDDYEIVLDKWDESMFDFTIGKLESKLFSTELFSKSEIEREKKQKRIEKTATSFVDESIVELKTRERKLNNLSIFWNIIGFLALVVGVCLSIYFISFEEYDNWEKLVFYSAKSVILLVLLLASSKYAFNLSKTYMNESLKNSDRIHAISFGKFYLQIFGDKIEPEEMKDVFQNWNINTESSFLKLNSVDFDPNIIDKLIKLFELKKK